MIQEESYRNATESVFHSYISVRNGCRSSKRCANDADGSPLHKIPAEDDGKDVYQERIDAAFEELFDGLKQIFPSASRDNDTLYSAVLNFSIAAQETYTVMGFLAGLRFCTDLRKACCSVDGSKIQSAIKKAVPEPDGSVTAPMGDGSRFEIRRRDA